MYKTESKYFQVQPRLQEYKIVFSLLVFGNTFTLKIRHTLFQMTYIILKIVFKNIFWIPCWILDL